MHKKYRRRYCDCSAVCDTHGCLYFNYRKAKRQAQRQADHDFMRDVDEKVAHLHKHTMHNGHDSTTDTNFSENGESAENSSENTYYNLKYSTYYKVRNEKEENLDTLIHQHGRDFSGKKIFHHVRHMYHVEIVPHKHYTDFHLPEMKHALASQPDNEQYLVDAYLTYLGLTTHLREDGENA